MPENDNNQDISPTPTPTPTPTPPTPTPVTPTPAAPNAPTEAVPLNTETEHMIPKSRFDEVNKNYKAAAAELKKLQRTQEAAATAELEEQGQWKTLAEQGAARTAELEAQVLTQQSQLAGEQRNSLTMVIAAKMGFDPTDENVMVAVSSVDISESDASDKIQQALEALMKARPYLVQGTKPPGLAAFNPSGQPQPPQEETDADRRKRLFGGGDSGFFAKTESGGVVWPKGKPD